MKKLIFLVFIWLFIAANSEAGKLLVVVNSWPPYIDKTLPQKGLAMAVVVAALQRKGYQAEISIESWSRALEGIEIGVYDVAGAIWKTSQREKALLFSKPYLVNYIKFIKKKNLEVKYETLEDLTGYLIGTVRNYAYDEAFISSEKLLKLPQNHIIQNLAKLREDEIDLTLGDEKAIRYELNQYMRSQANEYEFLNQPLAIRELHIAVNNQNPQGRKIISDFNQSVAEMQADGSLKKIIADYKY